MDFCHENQNSLFIPTLEIDFKGQKLQQQNALNNTEVLLPFDFSKNQGSCIHFRYSLSSFVCHPS